MKMQTFSNGAVALLQPTNIGWLTLLRKPNGDTYDRITCDDRRLAADYYKAFCKIGPKL
jgi:hypothetical protein